MRKIFLDLQQGRIDRSLFTENANAYFSPQALQDFAASLAPFGEPLDFTQSGEQLRGGMIFRRYTAAFGARTLEITTYEMPDGKLEQFLVSSEN